MHVGTAPLGCPSSAGRLRFGVPLHGGPGRFSAEEKDPESSTSHPPPHYLDTREAALYSREP